jgi:A/G-specific adenine glycosylase
VFIHEFFPGVEGVRDTDILPLVEATLDRDNPRRWYQALMDYGAALKESGNPSRRSAHHRPQSRFNGSRRQARGILLRMLLQDGSTTDSALRQRVDGWDERFDDAIETLKRDGMVCERDGALFVAP